MVSGFLYVPVLEEKGRRTIMGGREENRITSLQMEKQKNSSLGEEKGEVRYYKYI